MRKNNQKYDYEQLFTEPQTEQISLDNHLESIRDKSVWKYKTKTITSGKIREVEIYPIFKKTKGAGGALDHIGNPSSQAQIVYNCKRKQKHVARLLNANFTSLDIWMTLTYDFDNLPKDAHQAQKDIRNYIKRLRAYIKKHGGDELDIADFKYLYVTETSDGQDNQTRCHHHIIMNFKDRDIAEKLWGKGRTQARRLQPDERGLEGLARYIMKTKKYATKKYAPSKNLSQPKITTSEYKTTKTKASNIAKDLDEAAIIMEKDNKGWLCNDVTVMQSHFVSGVYIYVRMRAKDARRGRGG